MKGLKPTLWFTCLSIPLVRFPLHELSQGRIKGGSIGGELITAATLFLIDQGAELIPASVRHE